MFDGVQYFLNTIKHDQKRWSNGNMFAHQKMSNDLWSTNISRLTKQGRLSDLAKQEIC